MEEVGMKKLRANRSFDLLNLGDEFWVDEPMPLRIAALLGAGYLEEIGDDEAAVDEPVVVPAPESILDSVVGPVEHMVIDPLVGPVVKPPVEPVVDGGDDEGEGLGFSVTDPGDVKPYKEFVAGGDGATMDGE